MQIESLTVRLLQALDKNYDVVNMDAVLSVISALENTNITKEQLEATRLAKYINLFRRRTKSEQLAKRAKSLLKKWREMVGMQQRPVVGSSNELIRNEGATTSSNYQENINLVDGVPALQQNSVVSFLTNNRNAYSSSSYSAKAENYESAGKPTATTTAPTSFSNVLAGFSGGPTERNNLPSFANSSLSNGPNARRKHVGNLKRNADSLPFSETFYEKQSNLNSLGNCAQIEAPKISLSMEPIIIDIEDSNSDSNLVEPPELFEKDDDVVVINSGGDKPNKHKKSKKDKKRAKEKSVFQEFSTPLVVIDPESSLSQQPNLRNQATTPILVGKEIPSASASDEKIRSENLMVTNISEILSLSSSMSSVFPTSSVGATKNLFSQPGTRPLPESELSFAGKFAQQSGSSTSTSATPTIVSSTESKSNFIFNNEDAENAKASTGGVSNSNTFQPFVATVCNSNDSASESQSAFAITDCSSQANKSQVMKQTDLDRPKFVGTKDFASKRQELSPIAETIHLQANPNLSAAYGSATGLPPQEQKVPKKRGRKKGSKGIDSMIAKDTSLSSQMLMQSLGSGTKKVKTTKELYAEMQNRKMGVSTPTTPSHWGGGISQTFVRRDSFCSEPSLHSFDACSTNATVSTIATSSTPEKVNLQKPPVDIDSGSDSIISGPIPRESVAVVSKSERINSCQNKPSTKVVKGLTKKQSAAKMLTAVEIQLRELVEKLPAAPIKTEVEKDGETDTVPCSCKIFEVIPQEQEPENTAKCGDLLSLTALRASTVNTAKDDCDQPFITISIDNVESLSPQPEANATSIVKRTTSTSITDNTQPEKPKKSIFDLDFEDEEDPLQTLIAEVAAASNNVSQVKSEISDQEIASDTNIRPFSEDETAIQDSKQEMKPNDLAQDQNLPTDEETLRSDIPAFPTYKIEEDEDCLAKQRFELKVQKITNFHIRALHSFFIPNVNGNWDETIVPKKNINVKEVHFARATEELLPDGSNVVPKYASGEYIRKDLRDVEFSREFKPKARSNSVEELFYETPFLGVSRCLESLKSSHRKTRKHRQKDVPTEEVKLQLPDNKTIVGVQNIKGFNEQEEERYLNTRSVGNVSPLSIENTTNSPLKLVFDDITINVDESMIAPTLELSRRNSSESKTLLAIANVNFNNNQIESSLVGEVEANTTNAKISCEENLEGQTAKVDLCTQDHRTFECDGNGDIKNNNCNDIFDKLEESSCESHSSLKQTQKSINLKIRKLQEQNSSKSSYSKRKRRRKKSSSRGKRQKIKCIKIAINGGITTQRHIKMGSTTSEDDESDDSDSNTSKANVEEILGSTSVSGENERSGDCSEKDIEKDLEYVPRYGERNWEQDESKDADIMSEQECFDNDDEDYEYEDDLEEEDEYSGDFHEVVTRDISPSSESGNNHIVLTIKKTPSKINSPCSSLPPISPNIVVVPTNQTFPSTVCGSENSKEDKSKEMLTIEAIKAPNNTMETQKNAMSDSTCDATTKGNSLKRAETLLYANLMQKYKLNRPIFRHRCRLLRRKNQKIKPFRFPDEIQTKNDHSEGNVLKKKHQQLFFTHEIFVETTSGYKRPMFEMSSCSSSCVESSEYEYESLSGKEEYGDKIIKIGDIDRNASNKSVFSAKNTSQHSRTPENASVDQSEAETSNEKSEVDDKHDNHDDNEQHMHFTVSLENDDNALPEDNNGLLESFNNIGALSSAFEGGSANSFGKTNNCDELYSKDFSKNGNNSNLINQELKQDEENDKSTSNLECITGLRAVNAEDVNESGFKEFKEWNQLLQRRSYNDEFLTVLPYVVLD